MGPRPDFICGTCKEIDLADENKKSAGVGFCQWESRDVTWNEVGCVLYLPTPDLGARRHWVRLVIQQKQQGENQ